MPESLRDKRLVELSVNAMVAGSKYRGEFEERVQQILKEVTAEQDRMVLFIAEIHTIVGAGQGGGEGGLDGGQRVEVGAQPIGAQAHAA